MDAIYKLSKHLWFGLFCGLFAVISIQAQDFTVKNYKAEFHLNAEGYFDVVEKYDVNFHIPKHGVYRVIQTKYDFTDPDGISQKRKIKISNIKVPGHNFEGPSSFDQRFSEHVTMKIGDADKTIEGPVHYEIRYRVENAFIFNDQQVQFYWNIKPGGWHADFERIQFNVYGPEGSYMDANNCFVYSGPLGTTALSRDFSLQYEGSAVFGQSNAGFVSHDGENVTVLVKLPRDSIAEIKPAWPFWTNYGWTMMIAGLIGSFYMLWKRYGKDDELPATTSYYPPKMIDPAMAGYLINDHADSNDLISLIPHWGSQGLLRIEEIKKSGFFSKKDTKIIKLKELPEDSSDYEKKIFNDLFSNTYKDSDETAENEVMISSLRNTFYKTMSSASSSLKKKSRVYYDKQSRKIRLITYIVLVPLAIGLSILSLFLWNILAAILTLVTCIALIILNFFMIKKNRKGNEVFSELKGFKSFIKIAEENRLKMLLKEDSHYFESTMGYALAFGLFDKWSRKFDSLNVPPPTWYASTSGTHSSMNNFSKSFSSSMSSMSSNMVSSPSSSGSSGGGSSGGGFGGGGGGSW
ncbi:MAG: DUF2207 domain-containing protein [Flavobacteriaceae bacterium]|nr:DUF2207 domain-containing protein [Bacteroidia bacterium]NNF76233.1 DUF2207 domain-containing protein [Flavobacteriaceae bacterium]